MRLQRHAFNLDYIQRLITEEPETESHFTQYFGTLLTMKLRSRVRSAALLEDAKQETLVRVLTALKQKGGLGSPESLGAFVNSVCNNVLFELYRQDARTTPLEDEYSDGRREQSQRPDSALIDAEQRENVRRALAELPPRDKDLLRWLFFEERDKDDICREMNINRGHLRVLLHRAKRKFRDRFAALSGRWAG